MGWGPWWFTEAFLLWCGLGCFSSRILSIKPVAMALHPPGAASRRKHLPFFLLSCLRCFTLPTHRLAKYLLLHQEKPASKLWGRWCSLH